MLYCVLTPANKSQPPSKNCFAVKTFRKRNAEADYERELDAFRQITESGARPCRGMVQFYGGFEYKNTFNIVLEYADGGTFEEYLLRQPKPNTGQDVLDFWTQLFDTIKALFRIHEHHLDLDDLSESRVLQGWA